MRNVELAAKRHAQETALRTALRCVGFSDFQYKKQQELVKEGQNALTEGKRFDVDIKIVYDKNSKRPKRFDVKSTVIDKDGNKQIKEFKFYK